MRRSVLVVVVGLAASSAHAAVVTSTFVGPDGGGWASASNWSPPIVPNNSGGNLFEVALTAPVTVEMNFSPTVDTVEVHRGAGLNINTSRTLQIDGGLLSNDGSASILGAGAPARIRLGGDLEVLGAGELTMVGANAQIQTLIPGARITNAANHTIRGRGVIGDTTNYNLRVTNEGLIEGQGGPLTFRLGSNAGEYENINTGVIRAAGTAVVFGSSDFNNTGGLIEAVDGGVIQIVGSAMKGGTFATVGEGAQIVTVDSGIFDGSIAGLLRVVGANHFDLAGASTLNGTIRLEGSGLCTLGLSAATALNGRGVIEGTGTNPRITRSNAPPLVLPSSFVVRGGLRVGSGETGISIRNEGVIEATTAAVPMTINSSSEPGGFQNPGLMQAVSNELILQGGFIDNSGGVIVAHAGRIVRVAGVTLTGGTLQALPAGAIVFGNSSSGRLDGVNLSGYAVVQNGNSVELKGTTTHTGSLAVQSTGSLTDLSIVGPATLLGDGSVVLTGANARIRGAGSGAVLINGLGHTIRGEGRLGDNLNLSVINNGLIRADGAGPMTLDVSGTFTNSATGQLLVTANRTLIAPPGEWTSAGMIIIGSGGTLDRTGSMTLTGGEALVNGTLKIDGGSLQLGGGVLAGTGDVDGSVVATGGTVKPSGLLVHGNYHQHDASMLELSIGDAPRFTPLIVGGTATLGGTLKLTLPGNFAFLDGDTFTLLEAGEIQGEFATVLAPQVGCQRVRIQYGPQSVVAVVEAGGSVEGDLNHDRVVDELDVQVLLAAWGRCSGACCPEDLNGDGTVDGSDLAIVLGNWTGRARDAMRLPRAEGLEDGEIVGTTSLPRPHGD